MVAGVVCLAALALVSQGGQIAIFPPGMAAVKAHELALCRMEGIPTTPKELNALYHVRPSENAAPLYRRVIALSIKVGGAYKASAMFASSKVPAALLKTDRRLIELLPDDPSKWDDGVAARTRIVDRVGNDPSLANFVNMIMIPAGDRRLADSIGLELARRNPTDTSIRLLQVRAKTGRLPTRLPRFGASSLDPFSGQPLKYRVEGKGFLLYSVGADRVDNGGKPGSGAKPGNDEVVRFH